MTMETDVRLPRDLAESVRKTAIANMRSYSAEISVAAARYIQDNPQRNDPPTWERGTLERFYIRTPSDIYQQMQKIAQKRGWSVNQVYIAAVARHIGEEKES